MYYAFEMMFHIVKSIIGIERIYTPYGCGAPCRAALKCTVTRGIEERHMGKVPIFRHTDCGENFSVFSQNRVVIR